MRKSHLHKKHYLVASDFDKTLSFNDSGAELAELMGITDFEDRVEQVSQKNLVQQGGELAYLLLHDPAFKAVRKEHLQQAGKRVALKQNIPELMRVLERGIEDLRFSFYVISAAPEEVVQSALEGIVPNDHILGTKFDYDPETGAIVRLARVPAGYGKVAVLNELLEKSQVSEERVIYSGDGSSDLHVMLHVNQRKGYTIAVSQSQPIMQVARRTVLSDSALGVLVVMLEDICHWDAGRIRSFFEGQEVLIQEWSKMRTDVLTIRPSDLSDEGED